MRQSKLLIVEDEGLVALDLQVRLEEVGYSVTKIVDNMDDAIAAVRNERPDLVLMDIRIKGQHDGIETADRLQREFNIPSIFVTALGDLATVTRAKLIEPFGYIIKPVADLNLYPQIEIALWKHTMEHKQRISKSWLAAVLSNGNDGVILTAPDGHVEVINNAASEIIGISVEDAKGQVLADVFCPYDQNTGLPIAYLPDVINGECEAYATPTVVLLKCKNAKKFRLVEANISSNREMGILLGVIIVFRDVVDRRESEAQSRSLENAQALVSFGAGIGRELERIVTRIGALVVGHQQEKELSVWLGHAALLAQQINSLRETEWHRRQLIDLNQVVRDLTPTLTGLFADRGLKLSLDDKLPAIEANREELAHCLLGAILELRQMTMRWEQVEIGTQVRHDLSQVVLTIEDMGTAADHSAAWLDTPQLQGSVASFAPAHYYMTMLGGELSIIDNGMEGCVLVFKFPTATRPVFGLGTRSIQALME